MGLEINEANIPEIFKELRSGTYIFGEIVLVQPAYARIIVRLLKEGKMDLLKTREAIHEGILRCGRRCFEDHIRLSIPPTHTHSPEAIGYACLHGEITKEEAQQINFLYGGSLSKYMKYGFDLLDQLVKCIHEQAKKPDPFYKR